MSSLVPFILLLIACQLTSGDVIRPQAGNPSKVNYRLPTNAEPMTYNLELEPDLKNFNFKGQVEIEVKLKEATNTLTLNAKNLNVTQKDVTVTQLDAKPSPVRVTQVQIQDDVEFLVVQLEKQFPKDTRFQLKVSFTGELNEQNRGFYRSKYYDENYNIKYIATTHFEPTGARLAFPCWDEPAYKATFKISLTHSKDYNAISNMAKEKVVDVTGDKKKTTFSVSPKMSTYLVAFVVSDYEAFNKGDENFQVWTKKQAKDETELALIKGKQLLEELEKYTNYPYKKQMQKMYQVTVRDFSPSAMENWGLVTYKETALLYKEGVSTTRSKQSITTVIAHEFAHQWFGNLVSPQWWKYIWLNEGFATYMQYFITHKVVPEWRLDEAFVVDSLQGNAFVADAVATVRPMNHEAESPSEISSLFDSIAYQKAASVIRMMSHILTEQTFQKGLQNYLNKTALSVADSNNLLTHLQNAANKDWEGVKLNDLMYAWINKPGYPVVTVTTNNDGNFIVSQERFLLDGSTDSTKWWVPITYTYQSNPDFANTEVTKWLKPNNESLLIQNEHKDDWVIFNKLQTGYYRVHYDNKLLEKLDKYLKTKDYEKIVPVNRAQLIDDTLHMARINRMNYSEALSLTRYLNQESDYIPWTTAFRNLNFLHNMLRTSEKYKEFERYLRYITTKVVKDVGFEAKDGEQDLNKMLRVNVLKWACRANDEECMKFVKNKYETWLENSTVTLDANLKSTILCTGVKAVNLDTWKSTKSKLLASTKDEEEQKSLLTVLGCSDSPDILMEYLQYALQKNSPISIDGAIKTVVSESKVGTEVALKLFIDKYDEIIKENSEGVIRSCAESIANGITKQEQYRQLSYIVSKKGLRPEYLQSIIVKIVENLMWIDTQRPKVEEWLSAQDYSSASSVAITSFLLILSAIVTRFY